MHTVHEFLTFFTLFDCICISTKEWNSKQSHVSQTQQQLPSSKGPEAPSLPPSLPPKIEGVEKLSVFLYFQTWPNESLGLCKSNQK
jgi:hypothetical protein